MAGDYRYGGFSNDQLANYLGISVPELQMIQEVIQGGYISPGSMEQAQTFAGEGGGGPMGGANRLENILLGIQNIQAHPLGSQHKGFNPTDILTNIATGGLYGLGKGIANKDFLSAVNSPGQFGGNVQAIGNEIQPGLGTSIAMKGNLMGTGAGLGAAAFGGGETAGAGAGGENFVPFEGAYTAQPYTEAVGMYTPFAGNFTDVPFSSQAGAVGAGAGALGPALGAMAANQLGGMFGPRGSEGTPMPGASPMGMPGTPQQPRVGGAPSGSELDTPGAGYIDPAYIKRQKGGGNSRGIANQGDLSQQQNDAKLAALYGFSGGMQ